ncbi:hypothetical protein NPIL_114591 [Nephila pilipes]|uniref:Uncharacterized protein n=1 Tax=Nephila pilipes TaxID=299642 RepID=A0A8X6TMJ0_NEPPI|nr:hypothetical protein NPIL_114591 [Nephila pilipes]
MNLNCPAVFSVIIAGLYGKLRSTSSKDGKSIFHFLNHIASGMGLTLEIVRSLANVHFRSGETLLPPFARPERVNGERYSRPSLLSVKLGDYSPPPPPLFFKNFGPLWNSGQESFL